MTIHSKTIKPWVLALLRMAIGWHFLHEGVVKLTAPAWTSLPYLASAQGFCSSMFQSLASNTALLGFIDKTVIFLLIACGLSLLLGLFNQAGILGSIFLLFLFYLAQPPLPGATQLAGNGHFLLKWQP